MKPSPREGHGVVEPFHRGLRPGEDQLEERQHDRREDQGARDRVQNHAIDRIRDAAPPRPGVQHVGEHGLRPPCAFLRIGRRKDRGATPGFSAA